MPQRPRSFQNASAWQRVNVALRLPHIVLLALPAGALAQSISRVGHGWFIRKNSTGRTVQISHSGSHGVFVALWYWHPVDRGFIYTVTNVGEGDIATGLVARIRRVLDG